MKTKTPSDLLRSLNDEIGAATYCEVYAGVVEGREQHTHALVDAAFARSGCP